MTRDFSQKEKEQLLAPAIVRTVQAETMLTKLCLLPLAEWPDMLDEIQRQLMMSIGAVERTRSLAILVLKGENDAKDG